MALRYTTLNPVDGGTVRKKRAEEPMRVVSGENECGVRKLAWSCANYEDLKRNMKT
jgi:hypothetical protein